LSRFSKIWNDLFFRRILNSKAGKSGLVYTFTNFFNAALPFLLLPIITAYLSEEDYGIATMIMVFVSVMTPLITLGITSSISIVYFNKEIKNFPQYIGNCMITVFVCAVVILVIFQSFSSMIESFSGIPSNWVSTIVLIVLFNFIIEVNLLTYKIRFKSKTFSVIKICQTLLTFILSYYLIAIAKLSWEGLILAKLTVLSSFAVISIILLNRNKFIKLKFNRSHIKYAILFGLPLVPHLLSAFVVNISDRLFITNYLGLAETGSYTVSYQIGSILDLLCISINLAWAHWLYSKLENFKQNKPLLKRITTLGILAIIAIAIVLILFVPLILDIFISEKFKISEFLIAIIVIGFAFQGFYLIFVNYLFYLKKTKEISAVTVFVAIINLGLNFILIPQFGVIGAAYATLISFVIKAGIIAFLVNKKYPIYG
jgi:O-antigen/teichoic acid export membrane protein